MGQRKRAETRSDGCLRYAPLWSDWIFMVAGLVLALAIFVLVVPTNGKPIVAGYLGWNGASK